MVGNDVIGDDTDVSDADASNAMLREQVIDPNELFENIRLRGCENFLSFEPEKTIIKLNYYFILLSLANKVPAFLL